MDNTCPQLKSLKRLLDDNTSWSKDKRFYVDIIIIDIINNVVKVNNIVNVNNIGAIIIICSACNAIKISIATKISIITNIVIFVLCLYHVCHIF